VFAASMEGLTAEERAEFKDGLAPRRRYRQSVTWSCRTCAHTAEVVADVPPMRALPPAPAARPALRSVPALDAERISAERLAAIRKLGGDLDLGTGA
jgi:hypothetical protein